MLQMIAESDAQNNYRNLFIKLIAYNNIYQLQNCIYTNFRIVSTISRYQKYYGYYARYFEKRHYRRSVEFNL